MENLKKEKVVFYFPWKELSGGPFYLTKLADSLAEQENYEVYYTDYKHGLCDDMLKNPAVKKIEYKENDFVMPFNEPITLITPVYWAHKVPKIHSKSKIVFLNWHYCCISTLKSTSGWSKYKLNKFLKLVKKTNSCFFLDYSHLIGQDTKKIKFKDIIVPITLKEKNIVASKDIVDTGVINIGVLGRIDGDKVYSILNLIDNLINLDINKIINLHIIGDGVHREFFEQEIARYGYLLRNINILMHGIMVKDELNHFMANNIDILFAMGTSALEGAAIHLPTVIIPSNSHKFNNNDYVWLHNSKKYCLGWFSTQISEMEIKTQTISEILDDIYIKDLKVEYGELDYEYYLKNHSSNVNNFLFALNQSTLNYKQLNKMLKSFDYKYIFSIRNVNEKKVIKILGIKISLKRKDYILRQDIQSLYRKINSVLNLKQENDIKDSPQNIERKYYQNFDTNLSFLSEDDYKHFTGDIRNEYINLIKNLDDESIRNVCRILTRLKMNYQHNCNNFWMCKDEISDLMKIYDSHASNILELSSDVYSYGKYLLPKKQISTTVFYYKHFIEELSNISRLKDKSIIDVGAGIGDSALILSEYTDNKVYSFEPTKKSFEMLLKTINLNSLTNVVCINTALGAENATASITIDDDASTLCRKNNNNNLDSEEVLVQTLDDYVKENNLQVGLIKVDVEGFEQEFLKGAKETICTQKPALLLSIYHNANDFFQIKPIIESWNLGYKFKIRKPHDKNILVDTTLIAEVE